MPPALPIEQVPYFYSQVPPVTTQFSVLSALKTPNLNIKPNNTLFEFVLEHGKHYNVQDRG